MFPAASALRPPFEHIVAASQALRNGLMVYAFGYLKQSRLIRNAAVEKES
jgi:hypothetical protein